MGDRDVASDLREEVGMRWGGRRKGLVRGSAPTNEKGLVLSGVGSSSEE